MLLLRYFAIFLIFRIKSLNCDYYSSIEGLEELMKAEKFLIENLEDFLKTEKQKFHGLKIYLQALSEGARSKQGPDYYDNPAGAFIVLKRMALHWRLFQTMILRFNNQELYEVNLKQLDDGEWVQVEDLAGAARGLGRLQDIYELKTADLANGILMDRNLSSPMTASDCFHIGFHLYNSTDSPTYAMEWLLEARHKLISASVNSTVGTQNIDTVNDPQIIKYLLPLLFQHKNFKLVQHLAEIQLANNQSDTEVQELLAVNKNYIEYERMLLIDETTDNEEDEVDEEVEKTTLPNVQHLYQQTCSGKLQPTPRSQRPLRCRYVDNGVPFCRLAKFKMEELSLDPYVAFYYDCIYESEIKQIKNAAVDYIERSYVGNDKLSYVSDVRTSKNTWLFFSNNSFLAPIAQRLEDITGLTLKSAEELQVANYGIGGHYGPHHDFIDDPNYSYNGMGNRILTALFYINEVEMGGSTSFPLLHLAVPPVYRGLVMWYNMHSSGELDYRTKHAGCPVIKGSKWICNEWFHFIGQEFHRPCGLKAEGHKSIMYKTI